MVQKVRHRVLLVEPEFPINIKSKNHANFLPIGLLKLASYYRSQGSEVQLLRGNHDASFIPDEILITSLFTYWSQFVMESVMFFRKHYPKSKIIVGGIYATLMPEHCKSFTRCDEVFVGIHPEAEKCLPAYDLVDVNYQIIHGMRGCTRKCPFCGIWKIEDPSFKDSEELKKEIVSNRLVFYDNNILLNPSIKSILEMLADYRLRGRPLICECQSGFDGRVLAKDPDLAVLLRNARFRNIRLAWDFSIEQKNEVENWISVLQEAGYKKSELFIFMIYNWSFDYRELEEKRKLCYAWGVQISDCRYRPLNQTFDFYNGNVKNQSSKDYYIHSNWSDQLVKRFRRDVRKHNICIRHNIDWYSYEQKLERTNSKKIIHQTLSIDK